MYVYVYAFWVRVYFDCMAVYVCVLCLYVIRVCMYTDTHPYTHTDTVRGSLKALNDDTLTQSNDRMKRLIASTFNDITHHFNSALKALQVSVCE